MTAIAHRYADAARKILADFKPEITKAAHLEFERGLFRTERYKAEG